MPCIYRKKAISWEPISFGKSENTSCRVRLCILICGFVCWLALGNLAEAMVTGKCSNCHTMHNSQGGTVMGDDTPNSALLVSDCVGCHTGNNQSGETIPFVMGSGVTYTDHDTTGNSLAGGNFFFVSNNHANGHNVSGLYPQDDQLASLTPPGWTPGFYPNGDTAEEVNGGATSWSTQLTCAGTNGCHGRHSLADPAAAMSGAHHTRVTNLDGSTVGTSFRFLYGIRGVEAADWEYSPSSSNHNVYMGVDRSSDSVPGSGKASQTISFLCAECHGDYHSGSGTLGALEDDIAVGSPWLRHPTDFDMNNVSSKEYGLYNGASTPGGNTYNFLVPVGRDLVALGEPADSSTVFNTSGDAIVTCLSCHRAHGSPYYKIMRWDYKNSNGGDCTVCHTSKS